MRSSKPTVVLVHGAWHDERCWAAVMSQLRFRQVVSTTLTLPSTDPGPQLPGFSEDVAAVTALIDGIDGQVTLCGHGYGGMVISEAGNHHQVGGLVYLAAFCPRPGERMVDQGGGLGRSRVPRLVRPTGDGRTRIKDRAAVHRLYGDLGRSVAEGKAAQLLPSTAAIWWVPSTNPAWLHKPTVYVAARRDRIMSAGRSRQQARDLLRSQLSGGRGSNRAITINTGHSPFYSAPDLVADVLSGT